MEKVKEFLKCYWDGKRPLLLGYSGGPDSKALLYSLLENGCDLLHVAHVDHGWREESALEAKAIEEEICQLGLPFYVIRLTSQVKKNKEAEARKLRLQFFQSLFEKYFFQALLLGHHADDLAETSLKRLLEGAHLSCLKGMETVSSLENMTIWRPCLSIKKRELELYLETRELTAFQDMTNLDPAYLRSRLRIETLPFLERSFGKNVRENLCLLSERAAELKVYLDQKVSSALVEKKEWGVAVFLQGLERIEKRHLLQKISMGEDISLSRNVLESLLDWGEDLSQVRKIFLQNHWIVCRRGWVFFLSSNQSRDFFWKDQIAAFFS